MTMSQYFPQQIYEGLDCKHFQTQLTPEKLIVTEANETNPLKIQC
jgi:hypothetical protein